MNSYKTGDENENSQESKFLKRLAEERKKKYTQEELAEKIGHKNGQSISNWETGKSIPNIATIMKLADVLDCDIDYLLGRIDEPTHDIAFIHAETGLSTAAIKKLRSYEHGSIPIILISKIIEHKDLDYLLNRIYQLMDKSTREEIAKYHNALLEMQKNEIDRKWLPFTMFEDIFPVIDEVLKVGDEKSIESIIRFQITDKILGMIDDILKGKVGGDYE